RGRRDRGGDAPAGRGRRPGASAATEPVGAARPGDGLPEVPAQGAGAPLRQRRRAGRRPQALRGGFADPGPASGLGRTLLALGSAQSSGGGTGGWQRAGGAGPYRRRGVAGTAACRTSPGRRGGPEGGGGPAGKGPRDGGGGRAPGGPGAPRRRRGGRIAAGGRPGP